MPENRAVSGDRDKRGRFLPGTTGNAGGRRKGLMDLVRQATRDGKDVVNFLVRVMTGKVSKASVSDRLKAAEILADRGYGRPRPTAEDEPTGAAFGVLVVPTSINAEEWSGIAQQQQQRLLKQFEEEG